MYMAQRKNISRFKKLLKILGNMALLAILTILIVVVLRIFLFASFKIPSSSMEPTLLPGDFIIVNKLIPGPRLDWWPGKNNKCSYRINGRRSIERNEVLVFNKPYQKLGKMEKSLNTYYVKRCVAIPKDTFYIEDGIYKVKGISGELGNVKFQKEIFNYSETKGFKPRMFKELGWTIASFGPIYVPGEGTTVNLDSMNIIVYKNLIEYETGKSLIINENSYSIDDITIRQYTFNQKYYFVAGDFAIDSKDSRYWGLLPEDFIIGKASFIWKSKCPNTNKYGFDRFFKSIN